MSLQTKTIAGCPAYLFQSGSFASADKVDTDIFIPGIGELQNGANGLKEGLAALLLHGQPRFFNVAWPKRQIVAVQLPSGSYNSTLLDTVVAQVKALPDVGNIYATGLSMGAILWGRYLSSSAARAAQFAGCFLMSGNSISTTEAAYFKNLKMVLFGGTLDTTVLPTNYREIYPIFQKAGVDISYTEINAGHNNTVWDHFSPVTSADIYKHLSTPVAPTPIPQPTPAPVPIVNPPNNTDMPNATTIFGDATLDGTKEVVYFAGTLNANIDLPTNPTAFDVLLRNSTASSLSFNVDLNYDNTHTRVTTRGTHRIFWDATQKKYFVVRF